MMVCSTPFRAVTYSTHQSPLGFEGAEGRQGAAAMSVGVPPHPGGTKGISTFTTGGPWGFSDARQRSLLSFQLFYSSNNNKI